MDSGALEQWFAERGWSPFAFQREAWGAYLAGRSGLIHAPTGTGKTLAALFGAVLEFLGEGVPPTAALRGWCSLPASGEEAPTAQSRGRWHGNGNVEAARVLWITPMRALANDTLKSLRGPIGEMGLGWSVEKRTGDTSSAVKARQRTRLPTVLVTTPESLTILLSFPESARAMRSLRAVVVDEWHELLGTKRGVQTELALSRLRTIAPEARTWGLSATLGNLEEAARALVGVDGPEPAMVRGIAPKEIVVETVLPGAIERFPWAGHLGTKLVDRVGELIDRAQTTLLFTNTRSQAEIWFRDLNRARPDLLGAIALHHGSLDREIRQEVERMLRERDSALRCVVCTSSLDLGVDFSPVDQVVQVGSPKGVARLVQRAGRSGHQPGAVSRIVCVPAHALELIEFASARAAIVGGQIEQRRVIDKPLDVLSQHLVTASMGGSVGGGGFDEAELEREVRSCYCYRELSDREWRWAMDFVEKGGETLGAYPDYARISADEGRWKVASRRIATRHRLGIGTIVSDAMVRVKYGNGRVLGSIEESFIGKVRVGERFVFAGHVLELVRLREMTATVRQARGRSATVPRWHGGKMPLSTQLSEAMRERLSDASAGRFEGAEMECVRPLLELQAELSRLPRVGELLIETIRTKDGHHAFLFPFGGRLAHEGLGAVLCLRLSRGRERSITAVVNDYGIELVSEEDLELDEAGWREALSVEGLAEDLVASIDESQIARRQFREIARIAGLTHEGFPGQAKPMRHMQASSDMFYDVFSEFDPGNLLLAQARREVVEGQLEFRRLLEVLEGCAGRRLVMVLPRTVSPLAFPLFAESMRATTVSSETWEQRVKRMLVKMERDVQRGTEVRA